MKRSTLNIVLLACASLLVAELLLAGLVYLFGRKDPVTAQTSSGETATLSHDTKPNETLSSQTTGAPETEPAGTVATEPTEPTQQRYTLTFVGDCTLGSNYGDIYSPHSLVQTVGTDYGYPFRNVVSYFENDDFTMANLEVVLGNAGTPADKLFTFQGPAEFVQCLTGSSVEAVTLANNHVMDFGREGYNSTKQILDDASVAYAEQDSTCLFTTERGLVIGIYAAAFYIDPSDMAADIRRLKDAGAEIIVVSIHWGEEGQYRATGDQVYLAKAAIDAGADIVHGHHPHVLQEIKTYNGGLICYSLGNFAFGGNSYPRDLDSVIIQQEIIRDVDGTVHMGETKIIPCSISSISGMNNFQPTPYEEGSSQYERVLSKLNGSYSGADLNVDYEFLHPTEPTGPVDPTNPEPDGSADATQPPESDVTVPPETDVTTPPETGSTAGEETDSTTGGDAATTE